MDQKYAIDRFEEDSAVCETSGRRMVNIPFEDIPPDSKEGDILRFEAGIYIKDTEATDVNRQRIQSKFNRLKK